MPGDDRDEFDAIVERLDLDLSFPDDAPARETRHPSERGGADDELDLEPDLDDEPDAHDDQFYRRVDQGPVRLPTGRRALGLLAVTLPPLLLVVCTLGGIWLPRSLVIGCGLIFVAGAIFLISQLPEHGPSRPDWPDDGAAL